MYWKKKKTDFNEVIVRFLLRTKLRYITKYVQRYKNLFLVTFVSSYTLCNNNAQVNILNTYAKIMNFNIMSLPFTFENGN